MHEYPKMLYRGDDVTACLTDSITVADAAGEEAARADGYAMYAEIAAGPADDDKDDGDDKAELLSQAKALGIDADGRWGVKRLKDAIAAAKGE